MPWAQKLVEAEGLSVVSLIGGCWQTVAGGYGHLQALDTVGMGILQCLAFPWDQEGFFLLSSHFPIPPNPAAGISVLFTSYKEGFFPLICHFFFFWLLLLFLGALHRQPVS